jgi:NAD+ diphosphatase
VKRFERANSERTDAPRDGARALVTDGERFGVAGDRLVTIPIDDVDGAVFLGRLEGAPLYLRGSTAPEAGASTQMLDFRAAAAALDADDVALLSFAKGLLNWQGRARFCGVCGSALEARNGGHSRVCTGCGAEVFPRIDPAVMMLATHGGRILLAQHRGRATAFWSTLAGFVEHGESLEQAVARELAEETGLVARNIRYFGSQPWPLPASLMIGFTMEVESPEITIDESELADARWFAREELDALMLSGKISLSRWMIDAWRATRS